MRPPKFSFSLSKLPEGGLTLVIISLEQVQQANPAITGWAMVGGWPLCTDNALKWQPGTVKVVAVDALPPELPYVREGSAQALVARLGR